MGKNLFGGLFDFNHDGKTDFGETFMEYQFFKKMMEEKETDDKQNQNSFDDDDTDLDWRDFCEDGSEYNVNPYDYDTEEEYEEALADAKEDAEDW